MVGLVFVRRDDDDKHWEILVEQEGASWIIPKTFIRNSENPRLAVARYIHENYSGNLAIRDWLSKGTVRIAHAGENIETQVDYYLCAGEHARLVPPTNQTWMEYSLARVRINTDNETEIFFSAVNYRLRYK